jgi:hypothetical protein
MPGRGGGIRVLIAARAQGGEDSAKEQQRNLTEALVLSAHGYASFLDGNRIGNG